MISANIYGELEKGREFCLVSNCTEFSCLRLFETPLYGRCVTTIDWSVARPLPGPGAFVVPGRVLREWVTRTAIVDSELTYLVYRNKSLSVISCV